MITAQTERICGALLEALGHGPLPAKLHSRFRGAANLSTPRGLVTLLSPGRCLQPHAVRLNHAFDYGLLEPGVLTLGPEGVSMDGAAVISFSGAESIDLLLPPGPMPQPSVAWAIRRFLASAPDEGLSRMALGRNDGIYAALLSPRLKTLRRAARAGDITAAAVAAGRMAGCGPGLTPSSDDLLCGYLAPLPSEEPWGEMASAIAASAAQNTNIISAALLLSAGDGYFSEDVLALMACLRTGTEGQALTRALLRVACFGSSSGYDFLTGVYFGVLDACAIGGICIDLPEST